MKKIFLALFSLMIASGLVAQNQLVIPDTLTGTTINLQIQNGTKQFYPGTITQTMGINGNILAPTIILRKHQSVTMNVTNNLADTTTIHWHGMHVAPENDGGPHIIIKPGTTWSPTFEVMDHASTHWYHPHLHHKTYDQVQMGIAGFIIVRDSLESAINLPRRYGIDDFPLAIQTRAIDGNNQIITTHTALDTSLMVNGTLKPFLNAPAQIIRFRVLNGSPERVYNLGFSDNRSFHVIGGDGGLLTAPVSLTRVIIAPGERIEILVNLSANQGQTIQLMNYGTEIPNANYGARQPGMGPGQTIAGYTTNALNGANFNILAIHVGAATTNPVTTIPTSLITHTPWVESSANLTRPFRFGTMGGINGPFTINDAHYDMEVINERVPFNNTEIWQLTNQTPIAHPFHIHNVPFYILTINGAAPPAHMRGRKDVVLVPGGMGVVRFITKFEDFYNDTLPYMYHCHMLTHEDDGMMGQFLVQAPCNLISAQPSNINAGVNDNIQFTVAVNDTVGTTYQWQTNTGTGFVDLQNVGQYTGVTTSRLNVAAVSLTNNNQQFRCKVKSTTCEITSQTAILNVGSTGLARNQTIQFDMFPNPANDQLYVKLKQQGDVHITITNLIGQHVLTQDLFEIDNAIDIHSLKSGVYFVTIMQHNVSTTVKLIKQ
jgi:bilirubin oxidase